MPTPRVLFFDIGDTLVFDRPTARARFAEAARVAGVPLRETCLPDAWRAAERVALAAYLKGVPPEDPGVRWASMKAALASAGVAPPTLAQGQALVDTFHSLPFTRSAHPEAASLLTQLRAGGARLGAISDWEPDLPGVLASLGLLPFFDTLSISSVVGAAKPSARLFADGLAQMDAPPEDALHIGDWYELDVLGAQGAGIRAVLFDWAGRAPDAPCPRVETFGALRSYLRAL